MAHSDHSSKAARVLATIEVRSRYRCLSLEGSPLRRKSGMMVVRSPGDQGFVVPTVGLINSSVCVLGCTGTRTWGVEMVGLDEDVPAWASFGDPSFLTVMLL